MLLPSVSIVTISFNQGAFLEECIQSVLAQKSQQNSGKPDDERVRVEYVVVDPGSTDQSRELIEKYRAQIDDVVLERDGGPADGLNRGFAKTSGEILGYINADDRLLPGTIDYVAKYFASHPDVDVLCGAIRMISRDGQPALRSRTADRYDLADYATGICTIGQQGTFFRRRSFTAVGGFNIANRITWDGELLVDMKLAGARFAKVDKLLGDFRIYAEALTGSTRFRDAQNKELARVAEKIRAAGIVLPGPNKRRILRLLYRLDPIRHLRYMLVR